MKKSGMEKWIRFWMMGICLVAGCSDVWSQDMKTALQGYVDRGEMPGFVSILATPEKVLRVDCVGYADLEKQRPMTPDTLFWIASTTKIFTAAAVMVLVDEGKISLDEPLETYLPQFRDSKVGIRNEDGTITLRSPKSKPTVREALCHVGGWTFMPPWMDTCGIDALEVRKAAAVLATFPMVADPGEKYQYSQVGIDLAGAVVEAVSGMRYEDFLQTRFFDPLGMKETTFWPSKEVQETRLVKAYTWDRESKKWRATPIHFLSYPLECRRTRFAEPGGGLFSTPADLVKFFQMLAGKGVYEGKRYLSEAAVAEIHKKQTPASVPTNYGLGCFHHGEWFGHGGAYGNDTGVHAEKGWVAIYMVQHTGVPKAGEAKSRWQEHVVKFFQAL
ncbi:MAG: serine hydrolase domain-containing protein [Planctomycetia bacterium]|nr:serine hydrolase domain-containing protein [Planctomycetia bacterium]